MNIDSLIFKSESIRKNLEKLKFSYASTLKNNQELVDPYDLTMHFWVFTSIFKISIYRNKNFQRLIGEFKEQQCRNFVNKSLPQKDIELIIQNILLISLSQEDLIDRFRSVETHSLIYSNLDCLQELKRQEYKL